GRRARDPLGVDVPAGLAVLVLPEGEEHGALHRGQRSHRGDDGQHPGGAGPAAGRVGRRRGRRRDPRHRRDAGGWLMSAGVEILATALPVLASGGSDDGGPAGLLLAGPIAAIAVYGLLFRYYRNTDKSHSFETETRIQAAPITGGEQKVNEIRGTQQTQIQGNNVSNHRQRVRRAP